MIYALMDEYYFFSFIFNKLMIIMRNFINDGLLIYLVTSLTILASKIFSWLQIWSPNHHQIFQLRNSLEKEVTVLRLRFWANEEESRKSGTWVLSRTDQINLFEEWFVQIRPVLREMQGSLRKILSDLLLRQSSKLSQLQIQIRLGFVEILMEIYFLVDQVVGKNPILLWDIIFSI